VIDPDSPLLVDAFAWATTEQPPSYGEQYCESRDVFNARLERLRLQHRSRGIGERADLINAVLAEVGGNSFDHNLGQWRDLPGVYLGDAVADGLEIAVIADRGQGVRATIQRAVPGTLENDLSALQLAFLRRITGRVGERRGNGLKFVREVVRSTGMSLYFQSGSAVYQTSAEDAWSETNRLLPGCLAVLSFPI
jgi:hypothetical protein